MNMLARLPSACLIIALLCAFPSVGTAQEVVSNQCASDIYAGIATEQRVFRSVLYGQKEARQEKIGNVRYDKEGNPWLKTGDGKWESLSPVYRDILWNDAKMDLEAAAPVRRGIFERREAVTSDLLPEVIQSVRALQCRLKAQCEVARQSQGKPAGTLIEVQPDGCIAFSMPAMPGCIAQPNTAQITTDACGTAVASVLEREMKLLELQIFYDSAYRTLLQFAGQLEGFMDDFKLPLLQPLRQTVEALSGFNGVTCFLSQCDE